jgi:hypothetical protein
MYDAGDETRETVMRIHIYSTHAADIISDPACVKEMENIQKRYKPTVNDDDAQHKDDAHVDTLLIELRENVHAFCTGFPEPFKKEEEACDSDMDEDSSPASSSSLAQGQRRRLPSRVTRTTSNMNEISDDEEEEEEENVSPHTSRGGMNATMPPGQTRKTRRRQSTESVTALGDALNTKARLST